MEFYITQCINGFIIFDENLNIANYKLFKEEEVVSKLITIENNEITSEEVDLINEFSSKENKIIIETTKRKSQYKTVKNYENIIVETPNKGGEYLREHLDEILEEILEKNTNSKSNYENNNEGENDCENKTLKLSDQYEKLVIKQIKESSQESDKLLIQAINSVDDIDESISKLIERIRDWYTIYFPEMDTINNNETYIRLISESKNREEIIQNYKNQFNSEIEYSNGADIEEEDLIMIKSFANSLYSLQKSRKDLESYIDSKMESIAPNLRDLLGATLGAKLIAHIGSIKKLATYPASTVQIMGAEKAIFRHLKTGERPPKHGLIFQHPNVRSAKWWNRGKIARNLALKITLAVRKDVFSGEYDSQIAKDFLEKVNQIEKENPFPKKTSKRRQNERERERGNEKSKKKRKNRSKKYTGNKKRKRKK